MRAVAILWNFSRPHTVIGSIISILTLFMIVCDSNRSEHLLLLGFTIIAGVTCNIFIVGINQVADVDLDKINKPYLPIPSGRLSLMQAKRIVAVCICLSLIVSLLISPYFFAIILFSAAIGWAYSLPPLHLKKHHVTAALAISIVRGLLINLGGFLVFNYLVNRSLQIPSNLKILTMFIFAFSIAIAWFKDLPDTTGDQKFNIRSLAILYSPKTALIAGHVLVGSAYILTIVFKAKELFSGNASTADHILLYGHAFLLLLFVLNAFAIKTTNSASVKSFYKRFWWFFFAEYLLYLVVYI